MVMPIMLQAIAILHERNDLIRQQLRITWVSSTHIVELGILNHKSASPSQQPHQESAVARP